MTVPELRAFLERVAAEAPGDDVGVRVLADRRGNIERAVAFSPARPPGGSAELPGDTMRDAAALLQALDSGDLAAQAALYASAAGWPLASCLARVALHLAREVYDGDLAGWLGALRAAGNAADADAAG
jgi:hypothetical protein